jgi:hypothetical protein
MDADVNVNASAVVLGSTIGRMPLALSAIRTNGGTQIRAEIDQGVVDDYADAIKAGETFPPVVVFYDGNDHWLADGFHRYHGHAKAGLGMIDAEVRQGTQRDAILHSVGANAVHGLRRSNVDKRCAVERTLADAKWSQWSDREIARRCHVGDHLVAKHRRLTAFSRSDGGSAGTAAPSERKYTTRHGTEAVMQTGNISSARPPARVITRTVEPEFRQDPEFQAMAEESARDLEIERDERLAVSGGAELAAENESLRRQVATLDRRISALVEENGSLKSRARIWQQRAIAAGWTKGHANA